MIGYIPGHFQFPGLGALNLRLKSLGLMADVRAVSHAAGLSFPRRAASSLVVDDSPEERQMARRLVATGVIERNIGAIVRLYDVPLAPGGMDLPNITALQFSPEPKAIHPDDLVTVYEGPGVTEIDNPHRPSLAMVVPPGQAVNLMMLINLADAPPVWGVNIARRLDGSELAVPFIIQGQWPFLPVNHGNLIERTLNSLVQVVRQAGGIYKTSNTWVLVGPGANENFPLHGTRPHMLDAPTRDRYTFLKKTANPKAGEPGEPDRVVVPHLALQNWVAGSFRSLGVPEEQVMVLPHDTTSPDGEFVGKRAQQGDGPANPHLTSQVVVAIIRPTA